MKPNPITLSGLEPLIITPDSNLLMWGSAPMLRDLNDF